MKDEIKEIIDNLIRFRNEDNKFQPEDILTIEDVWLLLDYITNLQEENERLKIEKQEEYNRFNLMAKFRDRALERTLIYKSRIDKAIEFIDKYCIDDEFYINLSYKEKAIIEVKKILQGDDN